MTCPVPSELARFVDGSSSDAERATIEEHLDRCGSCRETVSATVRTAHARVLDITRLGRYELLAPLGAGAMGVVYAAYDPALERKVAIKVLPVGAEDPARRERLLREARALAKISDPNVVPVHDVGIEGNRAFVAMELVAGENLRDYLATPRSYAHRLRLVAQVGRGLAAAHAVGVTHRDVKPENIFVGRDGRVRIGDFGLAAADHIDGAPPRIEPARITRTGSLLGTPAYMAPEQLRGEVATPASDQYALCLTAYQVLFGAPPARDRETLALAPLELPGATDPAIEAALRRGLGAEPGDRFASVSELVAVFDAAADAGDRAPSDPVAVVDASLRAEARDPANASAPAGSGDRAHAPPARRHRRVIAVAALGALAIAGVFVLRAQLATPATTCATQLAAWTPFARLSIAGAFGATSSPLAGDAYAGVATAIDRWAVRYGDIARATCSIAGDPPRYAAQLGCLHARSDDLAALLDVYRHADRALVEHATAAALALDAPEGCTTAHPASEIHGLAAVRAFRRAGRYADAIAAAKALTATDPAAEAQLELELGTSSAALGKLDEARDHLSRAAARADAARDDRTRAEALVQSVKVVGDHAVDLREAARLEDQARAAVERAGSPPRLHAQLLEALGDVATRRGAYDAAAPLFGEAVTILRTQPDEVALAGALVDVAQVHARLGDPSHALAELAEAKTIATRALGATHPNVATAWLAELEPLALLHRYDDAIASGLHAVAIFERAGVDPVTVARALENVAIAQQMGEHTGDAIATLLRTRPILEAALGPDHVDVGVLLLNLGSMQKSAGKLDDAAAAYDRVIAIWTAKLGADHADLARPLTALGEIEIDRHHADRAIPLLERALALREHAGANVPASHLAHTRELLAEARAALKP